MIFATWKPAADIFYSGNHWLIKVELAGISPDDVEIMAQDHTLTVRGQRRDLLLRQGFSCHSLEIGYSNFERSFTLPHTINPGSVCWEYTNGILQIQLNTETA